MKLMSARDSRAPAPLSTANRAPGHSRRALEVEDAERRPQVPVRLRLEIEHARLAVPPHFQVVGRALAHGHARVRQVGQRQQRLGPLLLNRVELDVELLDLLRARAVGLVNRGWCRAPAASPARSRRPTCSAAASGLRARE